MPVCFGKNPIAGVSGKYIFIKLYILYNAYVCHASQISHDYIIICSLYLFIYDSGDADMVDNCCFLFAIDYTIDYEMYWFLIQIWYIYKIYIIFYCLVKT